MIILDLDDHNNYVDNNGWLNKVIDDWSQEDTIDWLIYAALYLGQNYSSIQHSLAINGRDLLLLTKHDFEMHDSTYGDKLYDLLHSQKNHNNRKYSFIHTLFNNSFTYSKFTLYINYRKYQKIHDLISLSFLSINISAIIINPCM